MRKMECGKNSLVVWESCGVVGGNSVEGLWVNGVLGYGFVKLVWNVVGVLAGFGEFCTYKSGKILAILQSGCSGFAHFHGDLIQLLIYNKGKESL